MCLSHTGGHLQKYRMLPLQQLHQLLGAYPAALPVCGRHLIAAHGVRAVGRRRRRTAMTERGVVGEDVFVTRPAALSRRQLTVHLTPSIMDYHKAAIMSHVKSNRRNSRTPSNHIAESIHMHHLCNFLRVFLQSLLQSGDHIQVKVEGGVGRRGGLPLTRHRVLRQLLLKL